MEMHSSHTKGTKTNVFFLQEGMSQSIGQMVNITHVDPKYTKNKHVSISTILPTYFNFFHTCILFQILQRLQPIM
jgi:hypothetical protein